MKKPENLNVGDFVRIKSLEQLHEELGIEDNGDVKAFIEFTNDMEEYCDKVVHIDDVQDDCIYNAESGFYFSFDTLQLNSNEIKEVKSSKKRNFNYERQYNKVVEELEAVKQANTKIKEEAAKCKKELKAKNDAIDLLSEEVKILQEKLDSKDRELNGYANKLKLQQEEENSSDDLITQLVITVKTLTKIINEEF